MLATDIVLAVLVLLSTIGIAAQYRRAVVFRLDRYNRTAGPELFSAAPFLSAA